MRLSRELGQFDQGLALYQALSNSKPAIAAHEGLGQSLLAETSPVEAIRQYETAEATYRTTKSLDRAFSLKRQIAQIKTQ